MTILNEQRRKTLAALVDSIYPATDGQPSASDLGVVDKIELELSDVDWNGERWYSAAPYETVPHPGHGWQGEATPAEQFGAVLDVLAAELVRSDADAVLTAAAADNIELRVIASSDLVRLIQRLVFVHATGAVLR